MPTLPKSLVRSVVGAAVAVTLGGTGAMAVTLIDNSTDGYYNAGLGDLHDSTRPGEDFPAPDCGGECNAMTGPIIFPVAEPDIPGFDAGVWLTGVAPAGGAWSLTPRPIPLVWAANTETAIVYKFDAGPSGLANFRINAGAKTGVFVWLDGHYLFGGLAPGGSSINEYNFHQNSIAPGIHYLQVLRESHDGQAGYDILVTADEVLAPGDGGGDGHKPGSGVGLPPWVGSGVDGSGVGPPGPFETPVPASLFLLGAGLVALGIRRRGLR